MVNTVIIKEHAPLNIIEIEIWNAVLSVDVDICDLRFYTIQQTEFTRSARIYVDYPIILEVYLMRLDSIEMYSTLIDTGEGDNRRCKYRYMLLEGDKDICNQQETVTLPCFGVEIIREDIVDGNVCSMESDRIPCMTTYRYKAVQLIKKLYVNTVSPLHLIDVAGSLADEWVDDFERQLNGISAL